VYLSSADAKGTVDKALAHGGTLRDGPMDIADLGVQAIITDDTGARIGVWQAKSFPGISAFGPVGTPSYFELITRDYAKSVAFYTDVCGWQPEVAGDTDEFRLSVLKDSDGETIAGIMDGAGFLPPDAVDQWQFYIQVADTDAALAKVTELGGTVVQPGIDTPYGRLAAATDSTGAPFKLVGPAGEGSA
jgi:predicted enzyme related to lactoylglutathione lyase